MKIDIIQNLQTSSFRRCLRVALFLFVIQLFAVSHLRAEDRIVVPTLKIIPGTTQKLAIHLSNKEEYTAFQAEFYFPKGITAVKNADEKYSVSLSSRKGSDHSISSNIVGDGGLKVAAFSMSNTSFKDSSGELFYVDIISDPTFKGPAVIEVKGVLFTRTSDRKEIELASTTGIVDTSALIKGDANVDGVVNEADIVEIVNYMIGKQSGIFNYDAADANNDYEVNVADIILIAKTLLEQNK